MRLWIAAISALLIGVYPARAATTCQQMMDSPETEIADDASAGADTKNGGRIREIDGANLGAPAALEAALRDAKGGTALIRGGDFSGWNFAALKFSLAGVCFFESVMKNSLWDGGNYPGIGLIRTDLQGARFRKAKLEHVLLREANLAGVSMAGANLRQGLFDGGWGGSAENWDLTGADLTEFRFDCGITVGDGCTLDREGVTFAGADLTGADISTFTLWKDKAYRGARLMGTRIAPRQIAELADVQIAGSVMLVGGEDAVALSPVEFAELRRQHLAIATVEDNPSFPCAKAATAIENMICGAYESDLRRRDRRMAALYAMIRPKNPGIAAPQAVWLKSRNACRDRDCVQDRYDRRIGELQAMLGEPEILSRGKAALFIDMPVAFPAAFYQSPLFGKITPVLIGASMGEVVLKRAADGRYSIAGESIGANAHLCAVSGEALHFDPESGWFSGPSDESPTGKAAVFRWFDGVVEFPGDGQPDASFPGSEAYAGCGARARLTPMTQIAVSPSVLAKHSAYFETGER